MKSNGFSLLKRLLKPVFNGSLAMLWGIFDDIVLEKTLTVFLYHDVSDNPSEFSRLFSLDVKPDIFDYQIKFIKKNFNIIGPDDLLNGRIPPKAALITFDDGFRSYFKDAVDILKKHHVPSIIFLNMEPVKGIIFISGLITYLCEKREDFRNYLKVSLNKQVITPPLFIHCNRNIVDSYIKKTGKSFEKEVSQFVGELATEEDLSAASLNPLVFYGNHLFNHDIPLFLSEEELLRSFLKNKEELKKYPNYRDMFSFPFGQLDRCYSSRQIDLLFGQGAKKIFSSFPTINLDVKSPYLHRIPLSSFENSAAKILFRTYTSYIRIHASYRKSPTSVN